MHPRRYELLELVLDLGRMPRARFPDGDEELCNTELSREALDEAVRGCGVFGADNRAGIDRTLHRVSCLRNRKGVVVGLTLRVGRSIAGSAELIRDVALAGESILLLGAPGTGKTTAIRELARILADDARRRVVIVDSSNEIGGDGDVPHPGIGGARRMQVHAPELQHAVMIEAVENHMPQVIVVDEIGTVLEANAARTIAQRGVQLIATCHGHELQNVIKNPSLVDLVGGVQSVTLGDEEAKRRGRASKSVLERQAPPTFGVAAEMMAIGQWRVYLDVGGAVDALLQGREPLTQVRRVGRDGHVSVEEEQPAGGGMSLAGAPAAVGAPLAAAGGPTRLRLFCHGIDSEALGRVVNTLGLGGAVVLTDKLDEADCILALRSRLGRAGADDWLRLSARNRGVPLYAIKTDTLSQLVRALKTITSGGCGGAGPAEDASLRPTTEGEREALEEARLACKEVVIPEGRAVDLLPREPHIIAAQEQLIETTFRLVTTNTGGRLRILPVYAHSGDSGRG